MVMAAARKKPEELIQIAGVRGRQDLATLCGAGAPLIGFPLGLDVHDPDIDAAEATALIAEIPAPTRGVLITYLSSAREMETLATGLCVDIVQIHGAMEIAELRTLREAQPDWWLIRSLVVHPRNEYELLRMIDDTHEVVDAYITDSFDPVSGASGATGKVHDWSVSRRLVEYAPHPLILAGGLHPDNVEQAIRTVGPAGVDAHTGVEDTKGNKDAEKVRLFVERARDALKQL